MKSLKYCENYQNVTQKYEVSKCCWKKGTYRLAQHMIATNLQFVKNVISAKCNKIRDGCILLCVSNDHIIQKFKDSIEETTYE